jgi:hypothetical protein
MAKSGRRQFVAANDYRRRFVPIKFLARKPSPYRKVRGIVVNLERRHICNQIVYMPEGTDYATLHSCGRAECDVGAAACLHISAQSGHLNRGHTTCGKGRVGRQILRG